MLHSRFLTIASPTIALKTIRRTSAFFIWLSVLVLVLSLFPFFDSWSHSQSRAASATSLDYVAGLIGYLLGRILYNDWFYILALANGLVLRRYKSRVAATAFVLVSLYGTGLGLYMLLIMLLDSVSRSLVLFAVSTTVSSAFCLFVAGRALAAAIKVHGAFKDDPVLSEFRPSPSTPPAPRDPAR